MPWEAIIEAITEATVIPLNAASAITVVPTHFQLKDTNYSIKAP